jgi:hypothetical protein
LQERLARRGVTLAAALAASCLGASGVSAAVSRSLVVSTARAAIKVVAGQAASVGLVSTNVTTLSEGVLKTMFLTKLKHGAGMLFLAVALASSGTALSYRSQAAPSPVGAPETPKSEIPQTEAPVAQKAGDDLATRLLAPKRVKLVFKDTPLAEAVADFKKQSGYEISLSDPDGKLRVRTITLDTGEVTFWQALDQLCLKAGLVESPPPPAKALPELPGGFGEFPKPPVPGQRETAQPPGAGREANGIILTDGKAVQVPTDGSTSVRVRTEAIGKIVEGDQFLFRVQITPEPKLHGIKIVAVRIKKAIDSVGQNLEPVVLDRDDSPPPVAVVKGAFPGLPRLPGSAPEVARVDHQLTRVDPGLIGLKRGKTTTTSLSELSGTVTIRVPQTPETAGKVVTLDVPFTLKNVPLP